MIIARTPFRISLIGGGTDYQAWSSKYGGLVVGGAINRHCYVTVRHLPPFHSYKTRIVYSEIETINLTSDIQHHAVRACIQSIVGEAPLEIFFQADIPARSGTGSSSSFVVGLLNALTALQGRRLLPADLAAAATNIEQNVLGETGGCQDQVFAAHGGLNIIRFKENGEISVFPLLLSVSRVRDLEQHLLLFFSGMARTSSDIAAGYSAKLGDERSQFAMLRLAEQGIGAVEHGDWERLGYLIDQSWRIKAALPGVATPEILDSYALARLSGAWGGKITGAGGGGCMLLVAPPDRHQSIVAALTGRGYIHIPFGFDFDGSQIVFAGK